MSDYSEIERKAFAAGKKAATAAGNGSKEKKAKKAKKLGPDGLPVKRSGCKIKTDFKYKNGTVGPMLWGWRLSKKFGFVSFTAYLGKDDGKPSTGTDKGYNMVVNVTVEGLGKLPPQQGWWSKEYHKLTISDGDTVANPNAARGGYYGRGGERYKDKVK
jgi:hypothetical protein